MIIRPTDVQINAWTGEKAASDPLPTHTPWAQAPNVFAAPPALAADKIDERDWNSPGRLGVVLPDDDSLSNADRSTAAGAPAAIGRLVAKRGNAPVLRWRSELQQGFLRRYYPDGTFHALSALAPNPGTEKGRIPKYLLIYASPVEIPWAVQYALNMSTFVGRLDLTSPGLDRYVDALIDDFQGQRADPRAPVVWSVDFGPNDITWLMARAVAGKLWQKLDSNSDLVRRRRIQDASATGETLIAALGELSPALVVTTSHGMTGPLDNDSLLKSQLGALVDVRQTLVGVSELQASQPSGAIWYAHACCSAGSDQVSRYKGLLPGNGTIGTLLNKISTAAGATVPPVPRALLGAEKPLRAFVGHVEPTFDWTARPANKQVLTHVLCTASRQALSGLQTQSDRLAPAESISRGRCVYGAWQEAIAGINNNQPGMRDFAYRQLVAMDRQTLVIWAIRSLLRR